MTPIIPGTLKNSSHVSCCCRSRLNQTSKLVPLVCTFPVNCALQMAPQVEVGRCEIGRSRRPQSRSVSYYPSIWVMRVQKLLYVAVKMDRSSIMHNPHTDIMWLLLTAFRQQDIYIVTYCTHALLHCLLYCTVFLLFRWYVLWLGCVVHIHTPLFIAYVLDVFFYLVWKVRPVWSM
jgi:hypothetical protein